MQQGFCWVNPRFSLLSSVELHVISWRYCKSTCTGERTCRTSQGGFCAQWTLFCLSGNLSAHTSSSLQDAPFMKQILKLLCCSVSIYYHCCCRMALVTQNHRKALPNSTEVILKLCVTILKRSWDELGRQENWRKIILNHTCNFLSKYCINLFTYKKNKRKTYLDVTPVIWA